MDVVASNLARGEKAAELHVWGSSHTIFTNIKSLLCCNETCSAKNYQESAPIRMKINRVDQPHQD